MLVKPMRRFASWVPITAKVDITILLYEGKLEGIQGVDVGVEGGIRVPSREEAGAVGVQEGECSGEGVVVVDYVGQVGHAFAAFVEGGCEDWVGVQGRGGYGLGGWIDDVKGALPA